MTALSRKGSIIVVANQAMAMRVREAENRQRRVDNILKITAVCQALVQRATPICPTAVIVAEEGRNKNSTFPAAQTIYNSYSEVIQTWRRAYDDIVNIDAPDPISQEDLEKIDPGNFEPGSRAVMEALVCQVREVTRRNNALKQLISESVPTPADNLPPSADSAMAQLAKWLSGMEDSAFEIDDIGLTVSSKTRPGTLIMHSELFNELRTLTDDYELARKARAARQSK